MLHPDRKKGAGKKLGTPLGYRIFQLCIRIGGHRSAYGILYLVAAYYVLIRPAVRKKCAPYLQKRFPRNSGFKRLWSTYRMVCNLGKVLIDRAAMEIRGPDAFRVHFHDKTGLLETGSGNHGLILLMSHVGCWQVAMPTLDFLHKPVHLLLEHDPNELGRHYFEFAKKDPPIHIIDPQASLGGTLEMLTALTRDELVGIMGDRVSDSGKNRVTVDFLGDKTEFPYSAFKIASATGAPIVILLTRKTGPDTYGINVARIIDVPAGLGRAGHHFKPYVRQYASALEAYVQKNPYQFFNFYDMWKSRNDM